MSKIRKAMMGRYIMLMIILTISLISLRLTLNNYTEIQNNKLKLDEVLEKTEYIVVEN